MLKLRDHLPQELLPKIKPGNGLRHTLRIWMMANAFLGTGAQAVEAPTGYDGLTNGHLSQSDYDKSLIEFTEVKTPATGLGPVFNDVSCVACHRDPIPGGTSQIRVQRAGYFNGVSFNDPPGGSLIPSRAIDPSIRAMIPQDANVFSFRTSLGTLGDGYIEAIPDNLLISIANLQPQQSRGMIHGQAVMADILESPGTKEVGKFGWKAQHASLLSFSADAYRNEVGITTPLFPSENSSNGHSVEAFNRAGSPNETDISSLVLSTNLIRATKAPERGKPEPKPPALGGKNKAAAVTMSPGEQVFNATGCSICHVGTLTTLPAGTKLHGGTYTVSQALGSITIHPYSDFLLHDVGTGDGIVQNGDQTTRNKLRTPPLWGFQRRGNYLHDGSAGTPQEAIVRHAGEAREVIRNYQTLKPQDRKNLIDFLNSL